MSVIAGNLSETLFEQNMKVIKPNKKVAQSFSSLKALSNLNSMPQQDDELKTLMPVYLEQANLSTWYQSNPWEILTSSTKYGLPVMGGDLIMDQPPGYRPGNVLRKPQPPAPKVVKKEEFANSEEPVEPLSTEMIIVVSLIAVFVLFLILMTVF